jgi:hypothetical protein
MKLIGVDFTSAPSRRKPITVAVLQVDEAIGSAAPDLSSGLHCRLDRLDRLDSF